MQCMGLSLQAGLEGMKGIMAAPRGGAAEPTRSVECIWPAMETGEVRTTKAATIINGETCKTRREGSTKKLKEVTEKLTETETQDLKKLKETTEMKTETWGLEEVEGKRQEIDEHTQVEIGKDNGVELEERIGTRCEHQDSLLQEQREMVGSLEVDCDQVGPVGPNEVERDANGSMQSLWGVEASGSLVRTPTPDVIVPDVIVPQCVSGAGVSKGVQNASVMACVSACEELVHGPIQMGDTSSEPGRPQRVNLATAPSSRDGAYEVHGALRTRPTRARLRDPARKCSTSDTSRPRGRRKCRRVFEFGTDGSTCERVCKAPRAACHVFCSRNARSGFLGRYARAGLHGKPCRFSVRVTSPGTSQCERRSRDARSGFPGRCARAGLHGKPCRFGAWVTSLGTSRRELRANSTRCRGSSVCGPLQWIIVVVAAEMPGTWAVDFGSWVRVPLWWFRSV